MIETTKTSRAHSEELHPRLEAALEARYGQLVTGMAEGDVDYAYDRQYARHSLPMMDRNLATVPALTALGGPSSPKLKVNTAGARKSGLRQTEIGEVDWQTALKGGLPAAIKGLNIAQKGFATEASDKGGIDAT